MSIEIWSDIVGQPNQRRSVYFVHKRYNEWPLLYTLGATKSDLAFAEGFAAGLENAQYSERNTIPTTFGA